jgi:hypothetical protein
MVGVKLFSRVIIEFKGMIRLLNRIVFKVDKLRRMTQTRTTNPFCRPFMKYAYGHTASPLQKREMEEQEEGMSLESFLKWAADIGVSDSTGTVPCNCLGHSLSLSYFPHAGGYVQFHLHLGQSSVSPFGCQENSISQSYFIVSMFQ